MRPFADAGEILARFDIADVAAGVDGDHSANLQIADLHASHALSGFHRIGRIEQLADAGAGTGTVIAVAKQVVFAGLAGRIAHGRIRPDLAVADAQVKREAPQTIGTC
ncbi:MAG: hypothetical protein ACLVJ6_00355 [Merdibacter sp.]